MSSSKTPLSSLTAYATPAQFLTYYDVRQLGDLVADAGARVTAVTLLTDANLQAALNAASGEIEAACLVGDRYTPSDLNILTGMSLASLQKLCCDLAFWNLLVRRYPTAQPTESYKAAMEKLERARLGERIWGLQENADAGLPKDQFVTQQTIDQLGLSTTIARRMFGCRGKERRQNGGVGGSSGCSC